MHLLQIKEEFKPDTLNLHTFPVYECYYFISSTMHFLKKKSKEEMFLLHYFEVFFFCEWVVLLGLIFIDTPELSRRCWTDTSLNETESLAVISWTETP